MHNNLKKYRKNLGYSQIEFAKLLNVRQAQLSKLENNLMKEIPSELFRSIKKIDSNVDILYVMGISDSPISNDLDNCDEIRKELRSKTKELQELKVKNRSLESLVETLNFVVKEKYSDSKYSIKNSLNERPNLFSQSLNKDNIIAKLNSNNKSNLPNNTSSAFQKIIKDYPEILKANKEKYTEFDSVRNILNYNSEGSVGQKAYFDLIEKYAAIKKLFVLGLREAAVEASINDVFEEAIIQRDYHLCQDIARLLYLHFRLYEDFDTASKYKVLRDTFSNLLKLEYETEDVYFELYNGQQLPDGLDENSIKERFEIIEKSLQSIEDNFNYESSIYKYYYYLGKCLMGKTDEESLEFILEGLKYFENLYFKHEVYINTFRFYHAYYFLRKELYDICLSTAEEYFEDVKVGGPAWHKYLDLMAKCQLALNKLKEARTLAEKSHRHESFKSLPKINRARTITLLEQISQKESEINLQR